MNSSTIAKVAGGGTLLGGIGTGGVYLSTKEDIWSQVEKECIPSSLKDEGIWKKAQDKLSNANESDLSETFKKLKKQITDATETDPKKTKGAYLMEGCFNLYSQNFKSIFSETKEDKLIDNIKTYCSLKVNERLVTTYLIAEDAIDEVWKAAQDKFKSVSKESLSEKFEELHTTINQTTTTTNGKELKDKCKEFYSSYIKSTTLVDDVSKYCTYTIGDKLTSSLTFNSKEETDPDMEAIKAKMDSITTAPNHSSFTALTSSVKDTKWKEYRTECQKLYAKQWKGSSDTDYTFAESNCKKTTPTPSAPPAGK